MILSTIKYVFYSILAVLGLLIVALIDNTPPQQSLEITEANFTQTLQGSQPVLINFGATWCGACQQQGPIIDELAQEYPQYSIGKLDVDQYAGIRERYYIKQIPTIIIFKNGQEVDRLTGIQSKQSLQKKLDAHS